MKGLSSTLAFSFLVLAFLAPADWAMAEPSEAQVAAIKSNCRSDFMSKCWGVPRGGKEAMQCLKNNFANVSSGCQQALKPLMAAAPPKAPAAPPPAVKPESAPAPEAQPSPAAAPTLSPETTTPATEAKAVTPAEPAKPEEAVAAPAPAPAQQAPKVAAPPAASTAATGAAAKATTGAETPKPDAAPATVLATPEETPIIGFIPPRKKLMILKNCRQDIDTHCPDVSYGEGRQLRCLLNNKTSLSADCQGALAKLTR
ncbi:MAG: cysteine rich repeat-containing protein [Methyloceanibacter sp.]